METTNLSSGNFEINFRGLEDTKLKERQKRHLKEIASNEANKLQRWIDDQFAVTLHIKEYDQQSKKQRYSIGMRVEYPGKVLNSERSQRDTWDVKAALRKAFDSVKNNLEKDVKK
tara:strand:+ start:311 stop:655 length:345 start_codon:yes stop_codon:yes gene_type:complete